jgi:hypothetical protein
MLIFIFALTASLAACSWFFVGEYTEIGTDRRITAADCSGPCLSNRQCTPIEKPRRRDLRGVETGEKIKFRRFRHSKFYECIDPERDTQ